MRMIQGTLFALALAAFAAKSVPVFADSFVDPFTMHNRALGETTVRTGDVSLGAIFRTDERYNNGSIFSGPRGWVYWNYLTAPKGYQNPRCQRWPGHLHGRGRA